LLALSADPNQEPLRRDLVRLSAELMSQVDEDTKVFLRRIWIPRLLAQTNMPAILSEFSENNV